MAAQQTQERRAQQQQVQQDEAQRRENDILAMFQPAADALRQEIIAALQKWQSDPTSPFCFTCTLADKGPLTKHHVLELIREFREVGCMGAIHWNGGSKQDGYDWARDREFLDMPPGTLFGKKAANSDFYRGAKLVVTCPIANA